MNARGWMIAWLGCLFVCVGAAQVPALEFTGAVYDFGTIREEDGPVSHDFEFTNTGKIPLVIERVEVSCGCTTPRYDREPVRPGGKGTVRVTFHPEGRPGAFRKDITVHSGGGKVRHTLTIAGEVTPRPQSLSEMYPLRSGELMFSSSRVNLGYVPRGTVKTSSIEYYNASSQPLSLAVVYRDRKPYFDVSLSEERLAPGGKGVMTVAYDLRESDCWGVLNERFSLMIGGKVDTTVFSASGVATEDFSQMTAAETDDAPRASFSSQYYSFGVQKAGEKLRREFTLTNEGRTPLTIRDMKAGPRISSTLDASRTVAPGESVAFVVTLDTKGAPAGRLMDRIVLIVNDPSRPMREIRLAANIAER